MRNIAIISTVAIILGISAVFSFTYAKPFERLTKLGIFHGKPQVELETRVPAMTKKHKQISLHLPERKFRKKSTSKTARTESQYALPNNEAPHLTNLSLPLTRLSKRPDLIYHQSPPVHYPGNSSGSGFSSVRKSTEPGTDNEEEPDNQPKIGGGGIRIVAPPVKLGGGACQPDVPVPGSVWLFGSVIPLIIGLKRRFRGSMS